jgi:hypothetical protein
MCYILSVSSEYFLLFFIIPFSNTHNFCCSLSQTPTSSVVPLLEHPQSLLFPFSNTYNFCCFHCQTPTISVVPVLKHPQPLLFPLSNTHNFGCFHSRTPTFVVPVLKHPQPPLFPWCERPSFTPTQNSVSVGYHALTRRGYTQAAYFHDIGLNAVSYFM